MNTAGADCVQAALEYVGKRQLVPALRQKLTPAPAAP